MAQTAPIYLRSFMQGMDRALFSKGELARDVANFVPSNRRTIRSLRGPARYEPRSSTLTDPVGVFHATLLNGTTGLLLAQSGTTMYKHVSRSWTSIKTGLSNEKRPRFPPMWCVVNDRVIWSNGIDRALQIDGYGRVFELGFSRAPSAPSALGPQSNDLTTTSRYKNYFYSWPGQIGTIGEVLYGEAGTLMRSEHLYVAQWRHINGDLSQLSPVSNVAVIEEIRANPYFAGATATQASYAEVSSLLRQIWVTAGAAKDNGDVVGVRLGRTRDVLRNGAGMFWLADIDGAGEINHPDQLSDTYLGAPMQDFEVVPVVHAMCNHAGSLVIANGPAVHTSLPGLAGSFPRGMAEYPSSRGAAVSAVASFAGRKLAFTLDSIVDLTDGRRVLAEGVGAAGPRCVCPVPNVGLLCLGSEGVSLIGLDGSIDPNVGLPIRDTLLNDINHTALRRAVSTYRPDTREVLFFVPEAGSQTFEYALSYDGSNWRRYDISHDVRDVCLTDDPRKLILTAATDGTTTDIFAWDREAQGYNPPTRDATFTSNWIQWSEEATPFTCRDILIELIDATFADATIDIYLNGSWVSPLEAPFRTKLMHADMGSGIFDDGAGDGRIGVAVNGTAQFHEPRAMWRQIHLGKHVEGVYSFAFKITVPYPAKAEFGRFIILAAPVHPAGANESLARIWSNPEAS